MDHIRLTRDGNLAELLLDRPKVNAMNDALLGELKAAFDELAADDAVAGVVIRGNGKCLSAGLDLTQVAGLDAAGLLPFLDAFDAAFEAAFRFPKPLAVAVEGHAIAGGLVLALCADFIAFADQSYKCGLTELVVGVPFPRVAFEIVRTGMPPRAFRKLVYGAGTHPPQELFEWGIGDALAADPLAEARAWLAQTCARPASTFGYVKAMHRQEAWQRIAASPLRERRALAEALLNR